MTTRSDDYPNRLLVAAERLLEAREDQMLTAVEWSALQEAVRDARTAIANQRRSADP